MSSEELPLEIGTKLHECVSAALESYGSGFADPTYDCANEALEAKAETAQVELVKAILTALRKNEERLAAAERVVAAVSNLVVDVSNETCACDQRASFTETMTALRAWDELAYQALRSVSKSQGEGR